MPEYITQTKLLVTNGYIKQTMNVVVSSAVSMSMSRMASLEERLMSSDWQMEQRAILKGHGLTLIEVISNPLTTTDTTE